MSCEHIHGYQEEGGYRGGLELVYAASTEPNVRFDWCPLCGEALTEEAKRRDLGGIGDLKRILRTMDDELRTIYDDLYEAAGGDPMRESRELHTRMWKDGVL